MSDIQLSQLVIPRVDTTGSLTNSSVGVKLLGDETTPGANKVYGTDADGNKGWKADPSGVDEDQFWKTSGTTTITEGVNVFFNQSISHLMADADLITTFGELNIGGAVGGENKKYFSFGGDDAKFTDLGSGVGLVYASDYSANFTNRSLIDKGFADTNYWKTSGTVEILNNIIIDANQRNFAFTDLKELVLTFSASPAVGNLQSGLSLEGTNTLEASGSLTATGIDLSTTLRTGANTQLLMGIYNRPTFNMTGHTGTNVYGYRYFGTVTGTPTTHYAMHIGSGVSLFGNALSDNITANTRVDMRGVSSGNILRLANSSNTQRLLVSDAGAVTFSSAITQDDTKTQLLVKDGTSHQMYWRDAANLDYWKAHVNTATALVDGASIDLTAIKHTLTSDESAITFTISYTGDDITLEVTLNATSATYTFPATALCASEGEASGDNTLSLSGVSGDKYIIGIKKVGSAYYVISKNFGQ